MGTVRPRTILDHVVAIDLFAGAGGFTEGARLAGVHVAWAANHWAPAIATHGMNHPTTQHSCQDLNQADFTAVPDHHILLASPACQGHSRARGKERPHHDRLRSTAWAVVACAEVKRPERIVVENVPEFLGWSLFPVWQLALEKLGYQVTATVLNAADFGVPQSRRRVFVVASLSGGPMIIEAPMLAHRTAREVVDLSAPGLRPIDRPGRSVATLAKIENARRRLGDEFLIAYYGGEAGGRSLDRPLGTVVTKDRFALVVKDRMRMLTVGELKAAMGFPQDYCLPVNHKDAVAMLGNAVCPPVATEVVRQVAFSLGFAGGGAA